MTDHELAALSIEDRNRILDAWAEEVRADLETLAELDREYYSLVINYGPLPGYDAFNMA